MSFSARPPIPRLTPLVGNRKNRHGEVIHFVKHCVRKVPQDVTVDSIFILWANRGIGRQQINRVQRFCTKGISRNRASLEIPEERFAYLCLGFGQNDYFKTRHSALKRAFASAQGAGVTAPARNAAWRVRSS